MQLEKLNNIVRAQLDYCEGLLAVKGKEYAENGVSNVSACDRLASFKKAAVLQDLTPEQALLGMLSKHLVSICDMCNGGSYPLDRWTEKITDSINYLLLLRALVEDKDEQD